MLATFVALGTAVILTRENSQRQHSARPVISQRVYASGCVLMRSLDCTIGMVMRTVSPPPGVLASSACPPWAEMIDETIDKPSPEPPRDRAREFSVR